MRCDTGLAWRTSSVRCTIRSGRSRSWRASCRRSPRPRGAVGGPHHWRRPGCAATPGWPGARARSAAPSDLDDLEAGELLVGVVLGLVAQSAGLIIGVVQDALRHVVGLAHDLGPLHHQIWTISKLASFLSA